MLNKFYKINFTRNISIYKKSISIHGENPNEHMKVTNKREKQKLNQQFSKYSFFFAVSLDDWR